MDKPKVGMHKHVPMGDYHRWPALSNSGMNHLRRSPAHYQSYIHEPPKDTAALFLGRLAHLAILEPDAFSKIVRGPEGDRRTKAVKDAWIEATAVHGNLVMPPADYDRAVAMRDSVWLRARCRALLTGSGDVELSATWMEGDVLCKLRADRISYELDGGTLVDVKTTRDASKTAFMRAIFAYGYHRQGAFYLDGFNALNTAARHFTIIAVENEPPHEVAIYRLAEAAIEAGRDQIYPLIELYSQCQKTGEWPGYPDVIEDITLPTWAWNQIDEEQGVTR